MPRLKEGKARAPVPVKEGKDGSLAPISERVPGYEGWDNYGQSGESWESNDTAWPDYAQAQWDRWGDWTQSELDTGQYPQQEWGPPTTSPTNAPAPSASGSAAFEAWRHNPQGPYGPPGQHPVAQRPPPTGPPPGVSPSHRQHDPVLTCSAPSWQNWGAEAMANSKRVPRTPTQVPSTRHGQQGRDTFAGHDSRVFSVNREQVYSQSQRMSFDSIIGSQGGAPAPKQPQHHFAWRSTQTSTHPTKPSGKNKKEKSVRKRRTPTGWDAEGAAWGQASSGWEQEDAAWDYEWDYDHSGWEEDVTWGQENSVWGQKNSQWEKEDSGWTQRETGWGGKQDSTWHPWGSIKAGRDNDAWDAWDSSKASGDDLDSDPHTASITDSDGWNDVTRRRNHQRPVSSPSSPVSAGGSPSPILSMNIADANDTAQDPLNARSPSFSQKRMTIDDYENVESLVSHGEALKPVENAFFGRERKACDRIDWQFPHEKDEEVRHALEWLHGNARSVAAFGVNKFLQTRERGALFINASYDLDSPTNSGPALDWLTYDDVVETWDRLLQESVRFYDPSMQVVVFVFLPTTNSGDSLAIWRRKIPVPDSIRLPHLRDINLTKVALRKDYPVLGDEMQLPPYWLSSLRAPTSWKTTL